MIWAIDLNQGFKGAEFLRGVTLVNWIIPGTAIGFLWSWIFNGQYGILNSILKALGILETGIPWLGQTNTALLCVIIARTWQMLPWYMAFLLGGLQSVSLDQIEAAHIDGANAWQKTIRITLPLLTPVIFYNVVMGVINALQIFTLPYALTNGEGSPTHSLTFYVMHLYNNAFGYMKMGYASAMAWILFVIILVLTLVIFGTSKKWVYYQ